MQISYLKILLSRFKAMLYVKFFKRGGCTRLEGSLRYATPHSIVRDRTSGERLKLAMRDRCVTISQLSEETGLSEDCIKGLRSGRRDGNFSTWKIISRRLGFSLDWLSGMED